MRTHSLSPLCAQASRPSYQCSCHCYAPLTNNVKPIDSGPRFSFPSRNKCTTCHLMSSLLPYLFAFKNRRSSKMILQIVAPLVASVGAAATLKQDLCISPMAPSFPMAYCQCNLSPERNRISSAGGNNSQLDPCPGSVRKGECGFWCTAKPFPPTTKGGMFAMHQRDPPPPGVGGEDIRRGSKGKMEMKFMVPMQFLLLVFGRKY